MTEVPALPTASELSALPIFPLPSAALFPSAALGLHVFEPRYREMTRHVLEGSRPLAVARLKPGFEADYEGRPPVYDVCGVGRVIESRALADGRYDIVLRGVGRVRIVEELPPDRSFRLVRAELLPDAKSDPLLTSAWQRELAALWSVLAPHLPAALRDLPALTRDAPDAGAVADLLAAAIIANPEDSQRLLEELDPAERLRILVARLQELAEALTVGRRSIDLN